MNERPQSKPVVLVVDDLPVNVDVMKGALLPDYSVRVATNGATALAIATSQPVDLILLDVMMPEMDGYEVCTRLRDDERTRDIPVIFVTALGDDADELKGFALGGVDYVAKPFAAPLLRARVRSHLALRAARDQLARQNELLANERARIERFALALGRDESVSEAGLRAVRLQPEEASGDLMLCATRPDGTRLLLIADFTGHGLGSALHVPLVTYIFHSMVERDCRTEGILAELNRVLSEILPTDLFMGTLVAEIARDQASARVFNAGMPDGLLLCTGGGWTSIASRFLPLGIVEAGRFEAPQALELRPDDHLFLFSDGVLECPGTDGTRLGYERLKALVLDSFEHGTFSEARFLDGIRKWSGNGVVEDDMTLMDYAVPRLVAAA